MAIIDFLKNETKLTLDKVYDESLELFHPTLRLGVTGLSGAGKTIFITALIKNLLEGQNLFFFKVTRNQGIEKILIEHQPDDHIPRFEFEKYSNILEKKLWPQSTRNLSQIRITFFYKTSSFFKNFLRINKLSVDILDYPGEWLIDLPLLQKTFYEFSTEAIEKAQTEPYRPHAEAWLTELKKIDFSKKVEQFQLENITKLYMSYLKKAQKDPKLLALLPPGRFLIPGEFEGSPAFTFFPAIFHKDQRYPRNSYITTMERRFEAYKKRFIFPFFREHIARINRQIILVDSMQALNGGANALKELENSLTKIISCFYKNRYNFFRHSINRILIAATKADHIHHFNHDKLDNITKELVEKALLHPYKKNAKIDTIVLSSIRSTYEAQVKEKGEALPIIVGTPLAGEIIDNKIFDGNTEAAIFPGDLPKNLEQAMQTTNPKTIHFVCFRPPDMQGKVWPHIRLDRAIEFLIGDKFT